MLALLVRDFNSDSDNEWSSSEDTMPKLLQWEAPLSDEYSTSMSNMSKYESNTIFTNLPDMIDVNGISSDNDADVEDPEFVLLIPYPA